MRPAFFSVGDAQRASRLIPISWRAALWDGPTIYGLRYFPCLSDEAADDVGDSQVFRSSPVGHGVVDEILRADAGMRQDFDQGSAGRRDQFAFDIRRIPGNPGQEFGRRRCRDGHDAVSAADKAAAGMERRRGDLFDAQVFQAPDRTDDIQDTVDGADFMKVYLVDGDAMHLGFGFCQGLEYGQALGLDIGLDAPSMILVISGRPRC